MHTAMKHILIAFLVGLILCPPSMVYAGGITPDAAAQASNRPTMDAAQNGVPVVNIAVPNGSGLSHNQFSDFNVDHQGVIFNNATAPGVSQLGGTLAPNANLGGRAASSILTEVTGTGRTSLGGYIEIFGSRANFILANPNGISINGGGFINTPKATLATGRPQFDNNHFLGIDVRDGDIRVEGAGVNTTNIDAFELITRVASINADIYANKLKVVTGQNRYDPATETVVPLAPDGSPAPVVSIDSAALGGMYAGRIELVGTEAGVGVNTQGIVLATQNLVMTADGKLQVKNTASSSGDLALTSENGEVAVSDKVQAVGTVDLTGKTVTVAKIEDTDTPIVKGGTVEVHAETLTNSGLIAADDTLSVASVFLENTGTLYSGGSGLFRIGDTLHNDQGVILSRGDMVLEGASGGTRMATLQNDSANIESLDGGLVFRAETFTNNNSFFSLVPGATELSYAEGGFWHYGDEGDNCYRLFKDLFGAPRVAVRNKANRISAGALAAAGLDTSRDIFSIAEIRAAVEDTEAKLAADPDYLTAGGRRALAEARSVASSGRLYAGKIVGRTDGVIFRAVTTRDSVSGQDRGATIAAQGDIRIEAGNAQNVVSRISSATGDIVINADAFDNEGQGIYERTSVGWGRGIFHNHESPDRILTGSGTEVLLKPIDYAYGTLDAGNRVLISSGAVTNGVTEHNGIYSPPDPASQQQKVADVTTLTDGLPQNGLFQENTNPAHNYRIETNPALTDLDTFYGSDYALARMGFNPNEEVYKRLGDKFYETRLVREQILELTGRRFLEAARTTDTDQFLALMDNAVQAHTDLDLTVGIALTAGQVAALNSDIVWFEYQEVDGEQLLVPVVYLCPASLDKIAQGGSVIAAGEVQVDTTGDTANAGLIASRGQVTINADNFLNNKGTLAGQGVTVAAADSIYNIGGDISGTDVALKADNNVVLAADTVGFSGKGSNYTRIAKAGKISATGDLRVEAGKDVGVLGTELEAGGDATLKADGNVAVSTMETTFKHRLSGSNYNTRTDSTYNHGSSVKAGGALTVEAGENVAVHGSELESGGDAALKAGGNVSITAATDSTDFYSHNQGGSGGFFGGKKSTTVAEKTQTTAASTVKSGGSLTVETGSAPDSDLSVVGSKLSAEGDVDLKAGGEMLISSAEETRGRRNDASSSSLFSAKSSKSASGSTTQVASEVTAGGAVAAQANADLAISASNIHGEQGVSLKSETGDVRIAAGQNESSSMREEKSSGIGLFVSKGRLDVARFKEESSRSAGSGNVGSNITSGTDVTVDAANDATIVGSNVAAENDVNITAGRDANVIAGRNAQSSSHSSKKGGIGIGLSLSENEISISAGYKGVEKKTNSSGEYNASSEVGAGNDVNIDAGRNINQVSSDIAAGQDVKLKAGEDINVKAAQDVEHLDEYVKSVEVGLKLAAKQSVTTAIRTLAKTPENMTSGEGSAGAEAVSAASGALQAVSAAQQVSNPSASVSLTAGLSMSESSFSSDSATSVASTTTAGRDAALEAGQDLTVEGGRVRAEADVSLIAGEDVTVASAANSRQTSSNSSSVSAGVGVGATVSAVNGVAAGLQLSGSASGSDADYRADSNTNAQVAAGQDLTVKSGQDTTVAGANLEGNKVDMDVGGDLVVASRQDTSESKSSNWSVGGSATLGMGASVAADAADAVGLNPTASTGDSASVGMGKGNGSSAWVHNQTSIIGKEQVDIRVEKNTHVEGAVIAAENGNLKLDTDTLTYTDIYDHDKASNYQASVSVSKSAENAKNSANRQGSDDARAASQEGASNDANKDAKQEGNPYAGTLEGSASSRDRRQINRATIGEGEIIIRSDPDAGLEGLNRDLAKAQEITRDEKTSVTVYIDGAAIDEVASGGAGIKGNIKKLVDAYEAYKTNLPDDIKSSLDSEVEGLGEAAEGNMKEMIRQGVDPDVALTLLENEQYQDALVNNAKIEAEYQKNPERFLKNCGIELKDGETVADAEETSKWGLQWLASLTDGDTSEPPEATSEILDGETFRDNPFQLTKGENGTWALENSASKQLLSSSLDLRTILTLSDNSGGFDYQVTDGTTLVLQGLQGARDFIDSIPPDDIKMVQAAALGMQLATGGPVKLMLGYAVAMAADALIGDKVEATKDMVSEEVAAYLQSGALTTDEYKLRNCPDGDCSDKFASAGSYAVNMDKNNVKFGMNIVLGVVGSIVREKLAAKRVVSYSERQLKRKFKHAEDFGVEGKNYNPSKGEEFRKALDAHIHNSDTVEIKGTYRGQEVIHYINPKTGNNVMKSKSGDFISGWRLTVDQIENVLKRGKL
ncbi:hemagglutinin repeat-containing protein [Desulfovibrio sp. Huiquan2017]|uniref:hemagglutinin repeat-containing protein n=1 Tax=Desulfovibrio sp. Huiquan2017 TaxID=2816861 RepID=UPI001A934D1B|nr:hemagglutinin repeat-containing protein [Desulfovibrio sp. Huiquan2017]